MKSRTSAIYKFLDIFLRFNRLLGIALLILGVGETTGIIGSFVIFPSTTIYIGQLVIQKAIPSLLLGILYYLNSEYIYQIFQSIENGEIFTLANALKIRKMAYLTLIYSAYNFIEIAIEITSTVTNSTVILSMLIEPIVIILLGLALLAMAQIFIFKNYPG